MKQHEAVIQTMEDNGGYATLGHLNQNVLRIKECAWKTKTPFASIRRIVQDERFFFRIRPGLWALKSHRHRLPEEVRALAAGKRGAPTELTHAYYQGLLVELGNWRDFGTFVAIQDKNKPFLGKKLRDLVTVPAMPGFGYEELVHVAKSVDVVWFNPRRMPASFFEVEHSTDIHNSLRKFAELQDYFARFYIVADSAREREFRQKASSTVVSDIKLRVQFLSYEKLDEAHSGFGKLAGSGLRI